jgi:hypothetical protein
MVMTQWNGSKGILPLESHHEDDGSPSPTLPISGETAAHALFPFPSEVVGGCVVAHEVFRFPSAKATHKVEQRYPFSRSYRPVHI